jgi:small subunit ribosomal protein S7e
MQALFDLEATNNELKADLRDLYITAAKEVDVSARKAIIVHVSSCLHHAWAVIERLSGATEVM